MCTELTSEYASSCAVIEGAPSPNAAAPRRSRLAGSSMRARFRQSINAAGSICVTVSGNETFSMPELANAAYPTTSTPSGIWYVSPFAEGYASRVFPSAENSTPSWTLVRALGSFCTNDSRYGVRENTAEPSDASFGGMAKLLIFVPRNASCPIDVIVLGRVTSRMYSFWQNAW